MTDYFADMLYLVIVQETQTYDITGLSPYQLVIVNITATNGGGTSDFSVAVSNRSCEAGDYGTLLKSNYYLLFL